jgi:imidazole glycerol-phosphate synthase
MDGFMKRIIACMDFRANDDGDLVVTKGDEYDAREKEHPRVLKIATNTNTTPSVNGTRDRGRSPARKVRNLGKPVALTIRYFESGADEVYLLNITSFHQSPRPTNTCRRTRSCVGYICAPYDQSRNQGYG